MNRSSWKTVVLCGSVMSIFLFASAFTLLWIRNDVARDANRIAGLEYKLLRLQDSLAALEVKVDDSVQPHVLKSRTEGTLQTPAEGQVVRILAVENNPDEAQRWAFRVQKNDKGKGGV